MVKFQQGKSIRARRLRKIHAKNLRNEKLYAAHGFIRRTTKHPTYRKLSTVLKTVEESPFVRALVLVALIFGVWQIWTGAQFNKAESLARNWSILTTAASGNSGKVGALEYLNLENENLIGIDLSCEAMKGTTIDDVGSEYCARKTYLVGLDIGGGWLRRPAILREANLGQTDLSLAELNGVSLRNAILTGSDLFGANLRKAWLLESNLSETDLRQARLDDTYAADAIFDGSVSYETNFESAYIAGASFREAEIEFSIFRFAEGYEPIFAMAKIDNATFTHVDLDSADFSESHIRSTNFSESRLFEASFVGATLLDPEFRNSSLLNADFSRSVITWPDFDGAEMKGADFSDALLLGGDYSRALGLEQAEFKNSWAWADRLPVGFPEGRGPEFICGNVLDSENEFSVRPKKCQRVQGQ